MLVLILDGTENLFPLWKAKIIAVKTRLFFQSGIFRWEEGGMGH